MTTEPNSGELASLLAPFTRHDLACERNSFPTKVSEFEIKRRACTCGLDDLLSRTPTESSGLRELERELAIAYATESVCDYLGCQTGEWAKNYEWLDYIEPCVSYLKLRGLLEEMDDLVLVRSEQGEGE